MHLQKFIVNQLTEGFCFCVLLNVKKHIYLFVLEALWLMSYGGCR